MSGTRISNLWGKITILLIIYCLMTGSLCVDTALALDGSGTEQDPWRIKSLEDFNDFAADANYWDDYTRLETDVNLAGGTHTTAVIAPDTDNYNLHFDGTAFTGVFDGNGHKITGLTIDDGGAVNHFLGLLGFIDDGEVRNLGLEGSSVSGNYRVGGLVGYNSGSISNCYSTGEVSGTTEDVGGLVGKNAGSVSNCYSTGSVNGVEEVGGLVGENYYGIISNCYSTGDVNGVEDVGGLVGWNYGGIISNCYSTGDVNGVEDVGGLVGWNFYRSVSNCYSTGDVNGVEDVGGLVGYNDRGIVSNCYSTGDVSGEHAVGGLVGEYYGKYHYGIVSNCYSTGDVNGVEDVGGLVGRISCYLAGECGTITNSYWDIETSGEPNMCGTDEAGICDPNYGLPTAQMQTRSTFTDAGWDFVGETINGPNDIWTIHETVDYPKLVWELVNLVGWYEVDFVDFSFFANHWQDVNCADANDCEGADLDFSDKVDWADLKIFFDHWLEGTDN